jgi:VanZ family protein
VIVYMAGIFVASSIPGTRMPAAGLWRFDKVLHACAFAGLAVLSWRATRRVPLAVAIATTYGALDELHQRFTPKRSSDPADLLADFVGACIGASLASMWVALARGRSDRAE